MCRLSILTTQNTIWCALCAPLQLFVSIRFQVYFTALIGLLFTFPSRYLFTIDLKKYLALPVSPGGFPQAIHVLRYSRTTTGKIFCFNVRDYYPLGLCFPAYSANKIFFDFPHINMKLLPYNPEISCEKSVWALPLSLAAIKGILFLRTLFSFPPGTEMFYFPGFASHI